MVTYVKSLLIPVFASRIETIFRYVLPFLVMIGPLLWALWPFASRFRVCLPRARYVCDIRKRCHSDMEIFVFVCLCRRKNCEPSYILLVWHLILIVCRPEGNDDYVRTAPDNPKKVGTCMYDPRSAVLIWSHLKLNVKTRFVYHGKFPKVPFLASWGWSHLTCSRWYVRVPWFIRFISPTLIMLFSV